MKNLEVFYQYEHLTKYTFLILFNDLTLTFFFHSNRFCFSFRIMPTKFWQYATSLIISVVYIYTYIYIYDYDIFHCFSFCLDTIFYNLISLPKAQLFVFPLKYRVKIL